MCCILAYWEGGREKGRERRSGGDRSTLMPIKDNWAEEAVFSFFLSFLLFVFGSFCSYSSSSFVGSIASFLVLFSCCCLFLYFCEASI